MPIGRTTRARRILVPVALGAAGMLVVLAIAVAAGWLWLRSQSGHRFVGNVLSSRLPGQLEFQRLAGSMLFDLRLDDAALRAPDGSPLASAKRIAIRFSPLSLLRGRPRASVEITGGLVRVETQARAKMLLDDADRLLSALPSPREVRLDRLTVHGGRILFPGPKGPISIGGLDVELSMTAQGAPLGSRGSLQVLRCKGELTAPSERPHPIVAAGSATWNGREGTLLAHHLGLQIGRSAVRLDARATHDRVDLDLHALDLDPAEIALIVPPQTGVTPQPFQVSGSVHGPRRAAALELQVRGASGAIDVHGSLDATEHRFAARFHLQDFLATLLPGAAKVRATGSVELVATLPSDAPWQVLLDGDIRYDRERIDPNLLDGRPAASTKQASQVAERLPGGRLELGVRARLVHRRLLGTYRVVLSDPGMAARVGAQRDLPPAGPSLELTGDFDERLFVGGRLRVHVKRPPTRTARPSARRPG